ncbi:dihydrofolate reductase family protein [Rathayibacter caricis]|nr:dihydrofolate reductase family protein [Rathayibacter caricis]
MGKIVVSSMVSVDGYTEGAGGDVSQMPMDLAFAEHNADRVRAAGRLLFGAVSYTGMMQYWPKQVDDPEVIPEDRYVASRYATDLGITVVSDSLSRADIAVWGDRTEIVARSVAHDHLRRLRETETGDILVFAAAPSGPICSLTAWWTSCICSSARRSSEATPARSPASRRSI